MSEERRVVIAEAVASFAWSNFGLDNVEGTVREGSTEWVAALAERIDRALGQGAFCEHGVYLGDANPNHPCETCRNGP